LLKYLNQVFNYFEQLFLNTLLSMIGGGAFGGMVGIVLGVILFFSLGFYKVVADEIRIFTFPFAILEGTKAFFGFLLWLVFPLGIIGATIGFFVGISLALPRVEKLHYKSYLSILGISSFFGILFGQIDSEYFFDWELPLSFQIAVCMVSVIFIVISGFFSLLPHIDSVSIAPSKKPALNTLFAYGLSGILCIVIMYNIVGSELWNDVIHISALFLQIIGEN